MHMAKLTLDIKPAGTQHLALSRVAAVFVALIICCGPVSAQTSWKFIAVGDSQGRDSGINAIILQELVVEIIDQNVDCVVFCGDLVWNSRSDQFAVELETWRSVMAPVYQAGVSVYPCRGNHENWGSALVWQEVFSDLPDNGPAGEKHMTYAAQHKNALFIALDEFVKPHRVNQAWLDQQLARNPVPLVFAFGHEPAFHAFHYDCLDDFPADRDRFWDSLRRGGGRSYFTGHDHFFNCAWVDDGDGDKSNDLYQFISGTAGAPFYPFSLPYDGDNSHYTVRPVYHAQRYGYNLVEVNDLNVHFTWMQRDSIDLQAKGKYEPNPVWGFQGNTLVLLSPNGAEHLLADSTHTIRWNAHEATATEHILIEYSADKGRTWQPIETVPNTGVYAWQVPTVESNECVLRISDLGTPRENDVSFSPFSIRSLGELVPDKKADFRAFARFAQAWKSSVGQARYQLDSNLFDLNDDSIDARDLSVFADYWLAGWR
jgi:hypothetical protein